ncbi:hypothetical protein QR680_016790 [Steinernema hermaphroditum]|uniref:Uncharacterized protein n=1 Tax=Steinernema hermaphroditum TaxID=289476 RepID=A0AA39HCB0_9BILA|nr:hypothetical protein QR680_016790 [Steinernema hermaphroditum]
MSESKNKRICFCCCDAFVTIVTATDALVGLLSSAFALGVVALLSDYPKFQLLFTLLTTAWCFSSGLAVVAVCYRIHHILTPFLVLHVCVTACAVVFIASFIVRAILMIVVVDSYFSELDQTVFSTVPVIFSLCAFPVLAWSTLAVWRCYLYFRTPDPRHCVAV